MQKLWVTYAWRDNENADIDHIIDELRKTGIEVKYDRVQLFAGHRLWEQLDKAITDPAQCDAWAIVVSKSSLASEACQEELAYALDRALRARNFPLIGIFFEPIDRSLLPSAIATRLYVTLQDPDWASRVADGVRGAQSQSHAKPPAPYITAVYRSDTGPILEIRPRSGRWYPFIALVPAKERERLLSVLHGPYGAPPGACMVSTAELTIEKDGTEYKGLRVDHAITSLHSAFVYLAMPSPSAIYLGQVDQAYEFKSPA